MIGSNNKLNNALATVNALCAYKHAGHFSGLCEERKQIEQQEEDTGHARRVPKKVGDKEVKTEKPVVKNEE
ncbi:hypothetical protein KKH82_02240 [Patescibacteria group bacterium]|nr:hypothetical protein [Patescibacteria group bacterium]